MHSLFAPLTVAAACLSLAGCSIVSPEPVWEIAKATASVASLAISSAPGRASDTVRHFSGGFSDLCIAYDAQTQVSDIVPALQAELRAHNIDSRVYDVGMPADRCGVWLRYHAQIDWDRKPFDFSYRPYVTQAALSLRSSGGQLLASSHYALGDGFSQGKWATTRAKLGPVVTALLTGVEDSPPAAPHTHKD